MRHFFQVIFDKAVQGLTDHITGNHGHTQQLFLGPPDRRRWCRQHPFIKIGRPDLDTDLLTGHDHADKPRKIRQYENEQC